MLKWSLCVNSRLLEMHSMSSHSDIYEIPIALVMMFHANDKVLWAQTLTLPPCVPLPAILYSAPAAFCPLSEFTLVVFPVYYSKSLYLYPFLFLFSLNAFLMPLTGLQPAFGDNIVVFDLMILTVQGNESRSSQMLSKYSTTEQYSNPFLTYFYYCLP